MCVFIVNKANYDRPNKSFDDADSERKQLSNVEHGLPGGRRCLGDDEIRLRRCRMGVREGSAPNARFGVNR